MSAKLRIAATIALLALAACGEQDVILPGERIDIGDGDTIVNEARPLRLSAPRSNADWTHKNGGPSHKITHPALGDTLAPLFSVPIGQGDSRRARITADPVVAGGLIYTLDARSQVTAVATNGETRWSADILPPSNARTDASGGGLAVADGRLFVATGYGELIALDANGGGELWRQDLDAPGGAAPTVSGGLVYLVARDNTGWALETDTGRIRFQLTGTPSVGSFDGGAGVAVSGQMAVFPFSSGEVIGAFRRGGLQRWSTIVSGQRVGSVAANISDISGDPVIDGDRVYVGNFSGRVAALDIASGERLWTATEGAVSPVWPEGGSLFLINDLNELVRLDASDGAVIWKVELPQFVETRLRQQRRVFAHYGPVLAGGRLLVASSDGLLRSFDPVSGVLVGSNAIAGGAASAPVVAGRTVYVVSKSGQLVAFR